MSIGATTLILAGLEAAILLMKRFPSYDQKKVRNFESDYEIYKIQQTLPDDHPDRNDSLFLRVRHRLLEHVGQINKYAHSDGKDEKYVSSDR